MILLHIYLNVLILVLGDDGVVAFSSSFEVGAIFVLILVLGDDGVVGQFLLFAE